MGRRYYCDYCDKTFIDDLEARRKHLQSSHHIKLRNLHYRNHREPKTILQEECEKPACKRFFINEFCQFAGNCKYTHYTADELWSIKEQLDYEEASKTSFRIPSVESWLQKYYENKLNKEFSKNDESLHVPWTFPEHLEQRADLPPSIRKITSDTITSDQFETWG